MTVNLFAKAAAATSCIVSLGRKLVEQSSKRER